MKPKKWKMWACYRAGAKLPTVHTSQWGANYYNKNASPIPGDVFPVEVRELPSHKRKG